MNGGVLKTDMSKDFKDELGPPGLTTSVRTSALPLGVADA